MNDRQKNVAQYFDGSRSSKMIAELSGDTVKYVQAVGLKFDLPRRTRGSASGSENGAYTGGRRIDRDGYVITSAPLDHPHARIRKDRHTGIMLEHRLVLEEKLGRYLDPTEIVDHIDGLRLHNCPSNLRLFDSNARHLKETITGQKPVWSSQGFEKMSVAPHLRASLPRVDTYDQMKKSGDARLIQILRAALKLGIDSPYLLGTSRLLEKAQISDFDRPSLERALASIYRKYA